MNVLSELKENYLLGDASVLTLLRKTFYIASSLKSSDMADWAKNELNGYVDSKTKIPVYRECQGHLYYHDPLTGVRHAVNLGNYQKEKKNSLLLIYYTLVSTFLTYAIQTNLLLIFLFPIQCRTGLIAL